MESEKMGLSPELEQVIKRVTPIIQARSIGQPSQTDSEPPRLRPADLERRGIHIRYHTCSFEEIERRGVPCQLTSAYYKVKDYAEHLLENIGKGTGLILKGPVGTMKTTLAVAVLRRYIEAEGSGLFVPMVSLLDTIFTLKEKNRDEWANYEEKIRQTGILVLDDLGSEYHQEWVLSKVDSIISERYNRMRPVIITTNLGDSDLKGRYAERIIDRLRSTSKVINITGKSLRETVAL